MKKAYIAVIIILAVSAVPVAMAQPTAPQAPAATAQPTEQTPPQAPAVTAQPKEQTPPQACVPTTQPKEQRAPHGLGVSVLLGMNMCINNGDATCGGLDPHFGFSGGLLYRFLDSLALDGNFHYGMYNAQGGDLSSLGVLFGPRAFFNVANIDLFLGLGIGWGQYKAEAEGETIKINGFEMGLSFGAEYLS